jgi:hypothetical protein
MSEDDRVRLTRHSERKVASSTLVHGDRARWPKVREAIGFSRRSLTTGIGS